MTLRNNVIQHLHDDVDTARDIACAAVHRPISRNSNFDRRRRVVRYAAVDAPAPFEVYVRLRLRSYVANDGPAAADESVHQVDVAERRHRHDDSDGRQVIRVERRHDRDVDRRDDDNTSNNVGRIIDDGRFHTVAIAMIRRD